MSLEIAPDNGNGLASSPFNSAQGAIDAATTVPEAVQHLTTFWIQQGLAFTSGHVVHALRSARKDLFVKQSDVGEGLRNLFENGELPSYDDGLGFPLRPSRKLRATTLDPATGATRTPLGTEVYVYGLTEDDIDGFEFEVNIAEAPDVSDGQGGTISAAAALLNSTPNLAPGTPNASTIPPVTASGKIARAEGKMVPGTPQAKVHSDGRLCIPRVAFEALAFATGVPVVGGDDLYAEYDGQGGITISQNANNVSAADIVRPTTDRLRLHLNFPGLTVGDEFDVTVKGDTLRIQVL
jgi:hypothetical protein